jgi:hypothetical protein
MAQNVGSYTNPLKKFKLVFLGEQSGKPLLSSSPSGVTLYTNS